MSSQENKISAPLFTRVLLVIVSAISVAASSGQAMDHIEVDGFARAPHEAQRETQWCWAASIEAVLAQYGIERTQPQIVQETCGTVENQPIRDPAAMNRALSNLKFKKHGAIEMITTKLGQGAPPPTVLLSELQAGHPVIVLYKYPSGQGGHCVVVYAVDYIQTAYGPFIQQIQYFDPWPGKGNTSAEAGGFAQSMNYFICVHCERS